MLTNATHSQREDHLKEQLSRPRKPSGKERESVRRKRPSTTARKRKQSPKNKKHSSTQKDLRTWRAAHGLTAGGLVKKCTPVLLSDTPKGVAFCQHPFFHAIPHVTLQAVGHEHLDELRALEEKILAVIAEDETVLELHRYGANKGVNLGLSVVGGGHYADKEKGVSGSIHFAKIVKSRPDLRFRVYNVFRKLLVGSFGKAAWYKRQLLLTQRLNFDSGETRTLPDMPVSAIWLTQQPQAEAVHCDRNVVGSTFLLTSKSGQGAAVCLCSPSGKYITHQLKPGEVMAGQWANYAHCNVNVSKKDRNTRTSWTIYLDGRVFSKRYVYVEPKGFVA